MKTSKTLRFFNLFRRPLLVVHHQQTAYQDNSCSGLHGIRPREVITVILGTRFIGGLFTNRPEEAGVNVNNDIGSCAPAVVAHIAPPQPRDSL